MSTYKFIRAAELSKILGINRQTIYKLTRQGKIPFLQVGGTYLYDVEKILGTDGKAEIERGVAQL